MESLFKACESGNLGFFLKEAYQFYHNKGKYTSYYLGDEVHYYSCVNRKTLVYWLYKLGKDYQIPYLDYKDLYLFLTGNHVYSHKNKYYNGYYRYNNNRSDTYWYDKRHIDFRERQGFHKQHCEVKIESEKDISNREWRERKGFNRSRSRHKNWRVGIRARSQAERDSSRSFRRMEKQKIKQSKWEDLADSNQLSKLYRDPWNWD